MSSVNPLTSFPYQLFNEKVEGKYKILTFLNQENGGPGAHAVRVAIIASIVLYAIPRRIPDYFPLLGDEYPLSEQRRTIAISVRNYLNQNPGIERLIKLANDTVFIASTIFILSHRQLAQKPTAFVVSIFPASCILIEGTRSSIYALALLFKESECHLIKSIAMAIKNFIRPNIWCPPENLWSQN